MSSFYQGSHKSDLRRGFEITNIFQLFTFFRPFSLCRLHGQQCFSSTFSTFHLLFSSRHFLFSNFLFLTLSFSTFSFFRLFFPTYRKKKILIMHAPLVVVRQLWGCRTVAWTRSSCRLPIVTSVDSNQTERHVWRSQEHSSKSQSYKTNYYEIKEKETMA